MLGVLVACAIGARGVDSGPHGGAWMQGGCPAGPVVRGDAVSLVGPDQALLQIADYQSLRRRDAGAWDAPWRVDVATLGARQIDVVHRTGGPLGSLDFHALPLPGGGAVAMTSGVLLRFDRAWALVGERWSYYGTFIFGLHCLDSRGTAYGMASIGSFDPELDPRLPERYDGLAAFRFAADGKYEPLPLVAKRGSARLVVDPSDTLHAFSGSSVTHSVLKDGVWKRVGALRGPARGGFVIGAAADARGGFYVTWYEQRARRQEGSPRAEGYGLAHVDAQGEVRTAPDMRCRIDDRHEQTLIPLDPAGVIIQVDVFYELELTLWRPGEPLRRRIVAKGDPEHPEQFQKAMDVWVEDGVLTIAALVRKRCPDCESGACVLVRREKLDDFFSSPEAFEPTKDRW